MLHGVEHVGHCLVALHVHVVARVVVGRHVPVRLRRGDVAGGCAHDREPARSGAVRDEARARLVVAEAAADRTPELDDRVPTAGDEQEVGVDGVPLAARTHQMDGGDARVALGPRDRPPAADVDPPRSRSVGRPAACRPDVHDRGDLDARVRQRERRVVTAVVRREHDRPPARHHAEAIQERPGGRGQHHAGPVVVGERDRPFVRSGREHHVAGAHVPDALDGTRPLVDQHVSVLVDAERGRAREHVDFRRDRSGQPTARFDQHRAITPRGGGVRLRHALGARADHQRLDVGMTVLAADGGHALVREPPDAGHAVRDQPLDQVDGRGGDHRIDERRVHADERARLLRTRRVDAAGTSLDRRAAHHVHAVREQRGRQRVAVEAGELAPVERERHDPRSVDRVPANAQPSHAGRSPVERSSSVDVSRTTSNHRRHPAACIQRSAKSPLGLSRMNR